MTLTFNRRDPCSELINCGVVLLPADDQIRDIASFLDLPCPMHRDRIKVEFPRWEAARQCTFSASACNCAIDNCRVNTAAFNFQ